MAEADPIAFLSKVLKGDRMPAAIDTDAKSKTWTVPTIGQRMHAAELLLAKVLPDLKGVEVSGPDGEPIQSQAVTDTPEARAEAWRDVRLALLRDTETESGRSSHAAVGHSAGVDGLTASPGSFPKASADE